MTWTEVFFILMFFIGVATTLATLIFAVIFLVND